VKIVFFVIAGKDHPSAFDCNWKIRKDAYRLPSHVVVLPLWVRSCVRITVISSSHDDEKLQCSVALGLQGRRCWAILVRKDACCSSEYAFVMVSSAQRERRSADMGVSRDLRALFILKEVQKRCQKSIGKFGLIRGLSCPINGVFKTVMHAHSGASSPVALDLSPLPQNVLARIHRGTHLPHVQGAQHHTSPWSDKKMIDSQKCSEDSLTDSHFIFGAVPANIS